MDTPKPYAHTPHGAPVYRTWDEAMGDPGLDLSRPWCVADPDYTPPPPTPFEGWPDGWVEMGATTDDGAPRRRTP